MRILHLNHNGSHVGGVEGYIADVSSALQEAGHSSRLIHFSPDDPGDLLAHSIYAPLPQWPATPAQAIRSLDRVLVESKPDVAYLHAVYHPTLIEWISRNLPTVAYVHGPYVACPGSAQYLRRRSGVCPHSAGWICLVNAQLERCCWGRNPLRHLELLRRVRAFVEAYQLVGSILVGSRFMVQLLLEAGMPPERVEILSPILFREPFPPLTFAEDSRTILFAGRLTPEKGLRHLLHAMAGLDSDWQLLVAGDGEEREPCECLAAELGLAQRVCFQGWVDGPQISSGLERSACAVVPSLWPEPFGRLGPEAYLRGRPVVAFAVGGIPDWLEDGVTGYLVPPGDTAKLGQSLRALLESPGLLQEMGQAARQKALTEWSAHAHVEQLQSTFEQVRVGHTTEQPPRPAL